MRYLETRLFKSIGYSLPATLQAVIRVHEDADSFAARNSDFLFNGVKESIYVELILYVEWRHWLAAETQMSNNMLVVLSFN